MSCYNGGKKRKSSKEVSMDYALIGLSVVLFGGSFLCSKLYGKEMGSGLYATAVTMLLSGSVGIVALLLMNGFRLEVTVFTLVMAALCTLNSIGFTVCSLKSFGLINLSLYSLFSMLGGMALPFVVGILFFHEPLTLSGGICFLLIVAALCCTVEKGEKKRGGFLYYAGIFTLNGMSGVLSKIFVAAPFEKTGAESYSIWASILSVTVAAVLLLLAMRREHPKLTLSAALFSVGGGVVNRIGNLILVITLVTVPASVQYPLVTAGTIAVCTAISFFMGQKPRRGECVAVGLAVFGILVQILLPIVGKAMALPEGILGIL